MVRSAGLCLGDGAVSTAEVPEGYACKLCAHFNAYPTYVYAHWRDVLNNKCTECGALHSIVMGHATLDGRSARRKAK